MGIYQLKGNRMLLCMEINYGVYDHQSIYLGTERIF